MATLLRERARDRDARTEVYKIWYGAPFLPKRKEALCHGKAIQK